MQRPRACLIYFAVTLGAFTACSKSDTPIPEEPVPPTPGPEVPVNNGPRLTYTDSIFYLRPQSGNYTVPPATKPTATAYYQSIPLGLSLDSLTGIINITQSEGGLRYKIYAFSAAGTMLDSTKIVISGVDYRDSIYQIASTQNAYDTAFPIYNARPELALPCTGDDDDDDDDDDSGCIFDETDLNGDGDDDIDGVIQEKLLIDKKRGTIDVEASFHAGIFGSSNPANGLVKDFTFYYRLQDASNRALNRITVRVYHFRTRNDIPQALLDTLNSRRQIGTIANNSTRPETGYSSGHTNRLAASLLRPKRPPIIVIVSH